MNEPEMNIASKSRPLDESETNEGVQYPCDNIKVIKCHWESILDRPGMYLGKKSLYGLRCFIDGILTGRRNGIYAGADVTKDNIFDVDWIDFEKWVNQKFRRKGFERSHTLALEQAGNDDEKAFDIWAGWFREFQAEGAK